MYAPYKGSGLRVCPTWNSGIFWIELKEFKQKQDFTLPKTNIAPEHRRFQKEISNLTIHFQVRTVSFREGRIYEIQQVFFFLWSSLMTFFLRTVLGWFICNKNEVRSDMISRNKQKIHTRTGRTFFFGTNFWHWVHLWLHPMLVFGLEPKGFDFGAWSRGAMSEMMSLDSSDGSNASHSVDVVILLDGNQKSGQLTSWGW